MGWIGKIVGAVVGLSIGGPLGMIAGIAFGNLFDKASQLSQREKPPTAEQNSQMIFFLASFSMLAKMAIADGRLLVQEQQKVEEFIQKDLKLDSESRGIALKVFHAALSSEGTFEQFAQQFYQNFSQERAMVELMFDILVRVAASDGTIAPSEQRLLNSAATIFNIPESLAASIRERYYFSPKPSTSAYGVLGLNSSASVEEIKKAYRRRSIDFHPDSIASKGLPEEFTLFASEQFRKINEAYETIKKERNIV